MNVHHSHGTFYRINAIMIFAPFTFLLSEITFNVSGFFVSVNMYSGSLVPDQIPKPIVEI